MEHDTAHEDTVDMDAPGQGSAGHGAPRRSRSRQPRLGSFVTIAVAVLMLFGAASRMGKMPETAALFGIDRQAENRIRQEEERLRTAITIGAVPVAAADLRPQSGALPIDPGVMPPTRDEVDPDEVRGHNSRDAGGRRSTVSMAVPEDFWHNGQSGQGQSVAPGIRHDSLPNSPVETPENHSGGQGAARQSETYVVANGDTWVKIAKRTLGDSKRWQEIQKANPAAVDGLRVGMRLVIPKI